MSTLTLAIETSNPASTPGSGAVAIVRHAGGRIESADVEPLAPGSRHDDALVPAIARLCGRSAVEPQAIDRVAVSVGPGGYTALRIGVTAAKLIARAAGARVFGVPTAEALIARVPPERREGAVAVLLAWKREDVWVRVFDCASAHAPSEGRLVGLDDLASLGVHTLVGDGALRRALEARGVRFSDERWLAPTFDPMGVFEASLALEPVEPSGLVPLYPREPEAVRMWNARAPGSA